VTARTAGEICKRFPLGDEARALLRDEHTPRDFLDVLLVQGSYQEAVSFLAHALPKREAVWWACLCVRQVMGTNPAAAVAAALQTAENWAAEPSEDRRRATMTAAEAVGLGTPAGCAAAAAFWSGGSMGPSHLPVIAPAEHLTGQGVAGAILLAAVLTEPEKAAEKHRAFIELGMAVAGGAIPWK
jgi:hypothetical protein